MTGCINPVRKNKAGGYAHFPGGGPDGLFCRGCDHAKRSGTQFVCEKAQLMSCGRAGLILLSSPACRYWLLRHHSKPGLAG